MNEMSLFSAFWILVFGVWSIILAIKLDIIENTIKKQAIEKGYAMHDPKTGEWKWKE